MRGRGAARVALRCAVGLALAAGSGCATRGDVADVSERLDTLIASVQQLETGWLECQSFEARGTSGPRRSELLVLMGPGPDVATGPGSAHELEMARQLRKLQAELLGLPPSAADAFAAPDGAELIQPQRGELLALRVVDDPVQGTLLRGDVLDARRGLPAFWSCRRVASDR